MNPDNETVMHALCDHDDDEYAIFALKQWETTSMPPNIKQERRKRQRQVRRDLQVHVIRDRRVVRRLFVMPVLTSLEVYMDDDE